MVLPKMGGTRRAAALSCTPSLWRFTKARNLSTKHDTGRVRRQRQTIKKIHVVKKKKKKKSLTDNTVPTLGHSICLQYRPHCSHPGDVMQRLHSEGRERYTFRFTDHFRFSVPAVGSNPSDFSVHLTFVKSSLTISFLNCVKCYHGNTERRHEHICGSPHNERRGCVPLVCVLDGSTKTGSSSSLLRRRETQRSALCSG